MSPPPLCAINKGSGEHTSRVLTRSRARLNDLLKSFYFFTMYYSDTRNHYDSDPSPNTGSNYIIKKHNLQYNLE